MDHARTVLVVILSIGMILSSNARTVSHDLMELVQIVADHQAEIEQHGHAHEDIDDLLHAYHDHAHEIADHDHNIAYLTPPAADGEMILTNSHWTMAERPMSDRLEFGLDRPPRV